MKKVLLGLALLLMGFMAYSQGLEGLSVERYYTANAADALEFGMPAGTVIWRFYVDIEPNWELNSVYGDANHELYIETYTSGGRFWNSSFATGVSKGEGIIFNPAFASFPGYYGLFLDSWISFGAATNDQLGYLKSDDSNGSILTGQFNTNALDAQDGLMPGTLTPITTIGDVVSASSLFAASGLSTGNRFSSVNGAWNILGGIQGLGTSNRILIAQVASSDGNLRYQFSVSLNSPTGELVTYVAGNQQPGESLFPQLAGTTFVPNQPPTAEITAPAPGTVYTTGNVVTITATGNDPDGSVSSMHFWVDGIIDLGIDNTPGDGFSRTWTSTVGTHQLTAMATDNEGLEGMSSPNVQIQVNDPNSPPTVSITQPTDGQVFDLDNSGGSLAGVPIVINATLNDPDGTITDVDLLIDGSPAAGFTGTFPYTWNSTATPGEVEITVIVTDDDLATGEDEITIRLRDPSTVYRLGSLTSPCWSPNVFCLDVISVQQITNVTGFDLTLNYDETKLVPTGRVTVYPGLGPHPDSTGFAMNVAGSGVLYISVFLTDAEDLTYWNKPASPEAAVFCVEFARTTSFLPTDNSTVSCSFMQESYDRGVSADLPTESAVIATYQDTQFMGKLVFWADNQPIRGGADYEPTYISNCAWSSPLINPDLNGNFIYDITNGTSIQIFRDVDASASVMPVINAMDAQLTARLVVNNLTPTVFQIIAMDVNMDGVVSAGDISQINQRTVFINDEFKQVWNEGTSQLSRDWLFFKNSDLLTDLKYRISETFPWDDNVGYSKFRVPTHLTNPEFCLPLAIFDAFGQPISGTIASDLCPIIEPETFVSVMLGDVNGNWKDLASSSNLKSADDYVMFDLVNARSQGTTLDIPITLSSENEVFALDFALQYNVDKLTLKSVIDRTGKLEMLSYYRPEDQTFRFTSYSLSHFETGKPSLALRFEMANGSLANGDLSNIESYLNGNPASSIVTELTTGLDELNNNKIKVYPNPANDVLFVEVSETVDIQLQDMNGRTVFMKARINANEKLEIDVTKLVNGIYLMRIYNDEFNSIQKVVIQK
jgi:hypothetical protein